MKRVYTSHNGQFRSTDANNLMHHDVLPVGTYSLGQDIHGFFLDKVDDMSLPAKVYGNVESRAERIISTFLNRPNSTGVLLTGDKGSGKTMLAKRLSRKCAEEQGIITILINTPLCGEEFNKFIQNIEQPAMVLFDEFEKVYEREAQEQLLTIFDGTHSSKKLFILTANDMFKVDPYMQNRPGRIYYAFQYGSLERDFITEYCEDNLVNKDNMNGIMVVADIFSKFSFDMLKALIEEMNRYDETATEAMSVLNMSPMMDGAAKFEITVLKDGKKVSPYGMYPDVLDAAPLSSQQHYVELNAPYEGDKLSMEAYEKLLKKFPGVRQDEDITVFFNGNNLYKVKDGVFYFKTSEEGYVVALQRKKESTRGFDYDAA